MTNNYIKNDFVGSTEYIINFENGIHQVKKVTCFDNLNTVFIGKYEECLSYLNSLHQNYVESMF